MSTALTMTFWFRLLGVVAAGSSVAFLLAALFCRWLRAPVWRRTVWRAGLVTALIVVATEVTGLMEAAGGLVQSVSNLAFPASTGAEICEPPVATPDMPGNQAPLPAPVAARLQPAQRPTARQLSDEDASVSRSTVEHGNARQALPAPPARDGAAAISRAGRVLWPGLVWLVGVTVLGVRLLLGRLFLGLLRRRCCVPKDPSLMSRVEQVAAGLGLRRRIRVLQARDLVGPAAFGWWRPTLVLPGRFAEEFRPDQQDVMLAHELSHLAAGDPAWFLMADAACALLWWQPLAWWARRRLHFTSEAAADEASQVVANGPGVLAGCLLELGTRLAGRRRSGWVAITGGFRSGLGQRVERLLQASARPWQPPRRKTFTLLATSVALSAATVLSTAWARSSVEGNQPMKNLQHSWQRSLAGMVLGTALIGVSGAQDAEVPADPLTEPANQQAGGNAQTGKEAKEFIVKVLVRLENGKPVISVQGKKVALDDLQATFKGVAQSYDKTDVIVAAEKDVDYRTVVAIQDAASTAGLGRLEISVFDQEASHEADKEPPARPAIVRLKVFRLQHCNPEEVMGILHGLLPESEPAAGNLPAARGKGAMAPGGLRGALPGAKFAPLGPSGRDPWGIRNPTWRLAADKHSHSLIVRGSDKDLQVAADLIAVLDLPPDRPVPKVKSLRAFRLRHADAGHLAEVLGNLELAMRIVGLRSVLIVAGASEQSLDEIGEVIRALDVEDSPPVKGKSGTWRGY